MLLNEEKIIIIKGIGHWVKIGGAEKQTTPLVIIHGGPGGHNYVFEHTIGKRLEAYYTVVYYEQRGSGRSESPSDDLDYRLETLLSDLEDLCIALGLDKMIPLGYSFGGKIALRFASKYPQLVERVIAEAPSIITDIVYVAKTQLKGFIDVANTEELKQLKCIDTKKIYGAELMNYVWDNTSPETQAKFLFYNLYNAKRMHDLWAEAWDQAKLMNTGKMNDVVINEKHQENSLDLCKNITCQTLIIIGEHDRNCGLELAKAYHESISHSTLVIVPNAAHFVDFEQENIFLNEVRKFLDNV